MEHRRGIVESCAIVGSFYKYFLSHLSTNSFPGNFYIELTSNRNFTVDDTYYMYLASSLNNRSDLVRIVARLHQFFMALTQSMKRY